MLICNQANLLVHNLLCKWLYASFLGKSTACVIVAAQG
jgi:hypothetical protein